MLWWLAVPAAVAAAASFAGAAYLQHQAARRAPDRGPLRPRLIWDLLAMRPFRWSIVLSSLAFVLQVVALRLAPLAVVQPLLVTQLLFYLAIGSIRGRRLPDWWLILAAVMAMAGLAGFQLLAHPAPSSAGAAHFSGVAALPLGIGLAALVVIALVVASVLHQEWQALPLAAATAVFYGVTAGLVRSVLISGGGRLGEWQLYAIIVIAPVGFLLNQNAFQEGRVGAVAVATITVGDPAVSIGIGAAWLGESLASGPLWTFGQVATLLLMAAGVLLLAHRAQRMTQEVTGRAPGAGPDGDHSDGTDSDGPQHDDGIEGTT